MRITGGFARGINLILPKKGEIRPATDYIREAVFSSLGDLPVDARVLDVFAGTGAYALEAISRGAKSALLVDKNAAAIAAQRQNAAAVLKSQGAGSREQGAGNFCSQKQTQPTPRSLLPTPSIDFRSLDLLKNSVPALGVFDLIFCDPPWILWNDAQMPRFVEFLTSFADSGTPWARIILEAPAGFVHAVPAGWQIDRIIGKRGKDQPQATILKRA